MAIRKALLSSILQICQRERSSHPQHDHFMHWTFLIRNNKIISKGVNRDCEPCRKYGYHAAAPAGETRNFKPKWHSELDSVKGCRDNLAGAVVVNVRLNKQGEQRLSMPCTACRNLLNVVNVSKVIFTTEFGWGSYNY